MTAAVIANDATDRYDRRNPTNRTPMDRDPEWLALKGRLDRGEWLPPGDAAKLLQVSRTKVHTMLRNHELRHRTKVGSKHRVIDPTHLRELLAEADRVIGPDQDPAE